MRILLLRSARLGQFYQAVDYLENQYPAAKISVLTNVTGYEELKQENRFEEVILFGASRFSATSLDERLLTRIQGAKFDFSVIIYTNMSGAGFENVHDFTARLGMPVCVYDRTGNFYRYRTATKIKQAAQGLWQKIYWNRKIINKIGQIKMAITAADEAVVSVIGEKSYEQIKAVREGFSQVARVVHTLNGEKIEKAGTHSEKNSSIIIVNLDGKDLLEECLPTVYQAIEFSGGEHEVIVVDNGSTDGSLDYVQENFPNWKLIALEKNEGFPRACNRGAAQAKHEILIFLNNDLTIEKDFLIHILGDFRHKDVFAVAAKALVYGTTELNQGRIVGVLTGGALEFKNQDATEVVPTLYVMGGGCAIDRKKFDDLNGFDELFTPGYWEDADICVRAWRRGWKSLYEPKAVLHHKVNVTTKKIFSQRKIEILSERNGIIFSLKNYLESDVLNDYWEHLTERITKKLRGKVDILWQALNQVEELLPQIITLRGLEGLRCLVTFKEIVTGIEEEI